MMGKEQEIAEAQRSLLDRMRYRPQQWSTRHNWNVYPASSGEKWYGFECVRQLSGVPPEILLVPLPGDTLGHAGVAVERTGGSWILQAGDACFYHAEMDVEHPRCTPGLRFYQWMMEQDRRSRLANQQRLRDLKRDHATAVRVISSHDVMEFEGTAHRPIGTLPGRPARA